ncbi:MAG: hypothetical protein ISR72_10235 [Methylobacter sp.]|nr:hypothetical protein [Methylobacter sp.]
MHYCTHKIGITRFVIIPFYRVKIMKYALLSILLVTSPFAVAKPVHHCSTDAVIQAKRLLDFHFGIDDRTEIDPHVTVLKPIKNPAGKGKFDVLEVYGHIYKGTYRMHFIYGRIAGQCLLIGQEILEITNL